MPSHVFQDEMRQVLDEVYRERETVAVRDVYANASARLHLTADMLAHLNEIPEGAYTRQEMIEAINRVIRHRNEQDTLGLIEEHSRTGEAGDTAET
ncbi:hypothetical protein [Microbispora sp. H11081]|uniref:hypothetical protein n=1 Tax=Microbispora sp. H11081 TaxID=2729107 RepID=UPI0014728A32|nr:hypothetical protein [Microbispora sp. H11081]